VVWNKQLLRVAELQPQAAGGRPRRRLRGRRQSSTPAWLLVDGPARVSSRSNVALSVDDARARSGVVCSRAVLLLSIDLAGLL